MRRGTRIALWSAGGLVTVLLVLVTAGIYMAQTAWFRNKVRDRIVSILEDATGGRVEIGEFRYDWHTLTASIAPLVIHGKERSGAPPFFRAQRIQIGLKIISALKKQVDIASLSADRPELHVFVAPDGTTNVPQPKLARRSNKNVVEEILDLKIRSFALNGGMAEYNDRRTPLDARGENLSARFTYDPAVPRYHGAVAARQMHLASAQNLPVAFDLDASVALEKTQIYVELARLRMQQSTIELSGTVHNLFAPFGDFDLRAHLLMGELARPFRLPIAYQGDVDLQGKAKFTSEPALDYTVDARIAGHDLAYFSKEVKLNHVRMSSEVHFTPATLDLNKLSFSALSGSFTGSGQLRNLEHMKLDGMARGFSVRELGEFAGQRNLAWNGIVNGPVHVEASLGRQGLRAVRAQTVLTVSPAPSGLPVQGTVELNYDQRAGLVRLGNSHLQTGSSNFVLEGTLGQLLTVHVVTRDLKDLLPVFALVGEKPPKELPVTLKGGAAKLDATVAGPLRNPRITGQADLTQFEVEKRLFDHLAAAFDLNKSGIDVHKLTLEQNGMRLQGGGTMQLVNWRPAESSTIAASFALRGADLKKMLAEAATTSPVTGLAQADVNFTGTYGHPQAKLKLIAANVEAYGERFDHVRADVTYSGGRLEIANGAFDLGTAQLLASAVYQHPGTDWTNGQLRFDVTSRALSLARLNAVRNYQQGLDAQVDVKATGTAKVVKSDFRLLTLASQIAIRNAVLDNKPFGDMLLSANTADSLLKAEISADIRKSKLSGRGEWRLEGDYPGTAHIDFSPLTLATITDLAASTGNPLRTFPLDGFVQGAVDVSGPLKKKDALRAVLRLDTVQVAANPNQRPRAGAQAADLVLKNTSPILVELTAKGADIHTAQFTARETSLQAAGKIAFDSKTPMDVRVNGSINLAILQMFNPDLLGSGTATVDAGLRGTLASPQLNGRLELKNASLYLAELPNGLDKAAGLIVFNANRATIQNLTAESGGGTISVARGSFIGFNGKMLNYRLRADAEHVRVRYPEGVSVTVNAALSMIGTSDNSVLSGTVTVMRAGFNPRTDVGGLLQQTARPISTPSSPNELLRGIQFDVRIESAQSLEFQTSLTRDLQAEAQLRLRGTPERPVVTGEVSVTEGEIQFFGNKYTINRGEINFYNPAKIEPIIDLDLETRVRGFTVDINFSGSINKLNLTYRSDPPLQTNEIIALLAVGRDPRSSGGLASSQVASNTNFLSTGTNALVGQAIASPVSNRLQRFFGVSRLKIDPLLTDLNSTPQARLTLEQQVSRDITLTYITNLTRTQEQILRIEWNLSRQWSAIATRDENGAFGVDFQYRKRFK